MVVGVLCNSRPLVPLALGTFPPGVRDSRCKHISVLVNPFRSLEHRALLCRPSEVDIVDTHLSLFFLVIFPFPTSRAQRFRLVRSALLSGAFLFFCRSWPLPLPPPPRRLVFGAFLSASATQSDSASFRPLHPRRSVRSIGSFACLLLFCPTYRACPTCRAYGLSLALVLFLQPLGSKTVCGVPHANGTTHLFS